MDPLRLIPRCRIHVKSTFTTSNNVGVFAVRHGFLNKGPKRGNSFFIWWCMSLIVAILRRFDHCPKNSIIHCLKHGLFIAYKYYRISRQEGIRSGVPRYGTWMNFLVTNWNPNSSEIRSMSSKESSMETSCSESAQWYNKGPRLIQTPPKS